MNLAIDIGNTRSKWAVFEQGKMLYRESAEVLSADIIRALLEKYPVEAAILSSVALHAEEIEAELKKTAAFIRLDQHTRLPFTNLYHTPETLGRDRLAAVAGALALYPDSDLLVIDAGTCITYDFIDSNKEYSGGSISPGIRLRLKALHTFTGKLPLVEPEPVIYHTGRNTKEAILSGVMNGIQDEVKGFIARYKAAHPQLKTVLTGGDAIYFESLLKNEIFAVPELVLLGLNVILEHHVKESA